MMSRLNRLLYRNTSAAEFATLFYAVVDLENGQVRYANAGHDFPFLSAAGKAHQLEHSGIVLGCMDEFAYQASECQMDRDSTLVVYTDGVTESESSDGEYYGTRRLRSLIERHASASAGDLCRAVVDEVREFGESEGQDDITLLVLKRCA
jgi:serine phosphatase RsbU (regulator of sigma subunit)